MSAELGIHPGRTDLTSSLGNQTGGYAPNRPQFLCNVGLDAFGTAQAYLGACLTCSPECPHSHPRKISKYTSNCLCWSIEERCCAIGLRTLTTGRWVEAGAARPVGADAQRHPAAQAHLSGQRAPLTWRPASSVAVPLMMGSLPGSIRRPKRQQSPELI